MNKDNGKRFKFHFLVENVEATTSLLEYLITYEGARLGYLMEQSSKRNGPTYCTVLFLHAGIDFWTLMAKGRKKRNIIVLMSTRRGLPSFRKIPPELFVSLYQLL